MTKKLNEILEISRVLADAAADPAADLLRTASYHANLLDAVNDATPNEDGEVTLIFTADGGQVASIPGVDLDKITHGKAELHHRTLEPDERLSQVVKSRFSRQRDKTAQFQEKPDIRVGDRVLFNGRIPDRDDLGIFSDEPATVTDLTGELAGVYDADHVLIQFDETVGNIPNYGVPSENLTFRHRAPTQVHEPSFDSDDVIELFEVGTGGIEPSNIGDDVEVLGENWLDDEFELLTQRLEDEGLVGVDYEFCIDLKQPGVKADAGLMSCTL